jgi:glycosyltransferase involved in cell wall biosynthesis
MIVRDEARILERCLDAARPAIDAVVVCDTGSGDRTPKVARSWLRRAELPGRVFQHRWRNFGHNRTTALRSARRFLAALGWDLQATYLLFLDADMVLQADGGFERGDLDADVYQVLQRNGDLVYPNVRLARASLAARFVGATHEYFAAPAGASQAHLATLSIDDRNDGGSRSYKLERDARLLEASLRSNPGDVRAMFYLAQTYRGLGDLPRALHWYRRRIAAGGWPDEVWYSLYSVGLMYAQTGETRAMVGALHAAIRADPARGEPWFQLATYFRGRGRHGLATFYAQRGLRLDPPSPHRLFVEPEACGLGLLRELAISGFYTRERAAAAAANESLASGRGVPRHLATMAATNAVFFAEPLAAAFHPLRVTLPAAFVPCNPSIAATPDGFLVNVRAVSYRIDPNQRYEPCEPDGVFRTRNVLVRLDRELGFVDERPLDADLPVFRPHLVQGLEDLRLVRWPGALGATCTTTQHHPAADLRMSLLRLVDGRVAEHTPLTGHGDERAQKNWLPFWDAENGELRAVYSYEPLVVLRIDPASGHVTPVIERRHNRGFHDWRGSAGPIELPAHFGGGRLLMVHEVAWQGRRYYLHRFVACDREWRIERVSRPFFFRRLGIEYACGMCLTHEGEDLLVTLGVEDREAYLARLPLAAAWSLLREL